ncbi:RNA-directed DNA polymerase, eukaryota [Tanacetum coccineum]
MDRLNLCLTRLPGYSLSKDVGNVLVWVKLHGVPVTAFSEDGLSVIATKLGTLLMLDSYTSDMYIQSWGRSCYARALIEVRADVELKDNIVVAMPKLVGEGFYTCIVRVEYEWKPPSGNKKKDVEPTIEVSNSNPFDVLNSVENDVDLGTNGGTSNLASKKANSSGSSSRNVTLVDDEGKPLTKVDSSGDHDSEDEVASVDNDMANFLASKKDGYGTNSLLEQWKESYVNGDYDFDPYDDDMYEG